MRFDGIDDFVDLGAGPSFRAHTLEAWVKPLAYGPPGPNGLIIVGQVGTNVGGCFTGTSLSLIQDRLRYVVGRVGCGNDGALVSNPVTLGVWHHLAGTYDGSTMRFYLDGDLVGELLGIGFDPYDRMFIAATLSRQFNTLRFFFPGEVDEIRVWDHARNDCEIREAACQILSGSEPGLIGYWRLDEGAGQTVFDSSPSGINGTLGRNADPAGDSGDPQWLPSEPHACPALCPTGDLDGDGVANAIDNCPTVANADQLDTDNDGQGDACDTDDDNDGDPDTTDCAPLNPAIHSGATETCNGIDDNCNGQVDEGFTDTDNDGQTDCVDPDDDNDGVVDAADNCPLTPNADQADFDRDGIGDACDPQTGPPVDKEQCKNGGWMRFDTPRPFGNQGDCIQFVNTGG